MQPTLVEAAFRRSRRTLVFLMVLVPLACWIWIAAMARDMYGPMTGASAWLMTMRWDAPRLVLLWAMWAAMMAGMMLPTAAPIVLLYAGTLRKRADATHLTARIYALVGGYFAVWALFSVGATLVQRLLAAWLILTPMMEPASSAAAAVLLVCAGVYQLTPLKGACLRACRSPLGVLGSQWREGIGGAFRMGVAHGGYCLGCCWALMLLLFAGGVMNLVVVLSLTVWVAVEKLAPFGEQSARIGGALLLAMAAWMFVG